ncbi:MAG: Glycerophosphoryl diester phosphodiesterase [Candidatus Ozemobacter sibiricus]|uniref:Glycerophosphoryl diester phosphodiesterase n=1 Tax=Candidatus Ozemobacter sibiricus TaxID=2268124 RepID=A0A367ZK69_9BACT|nr:MAG: Glycerophosphoryl diester phosphodiesterase [Candidatus Ozemobacter sibiricus]
MFEVMPGEDAMFRLTAAVLLGMAVAAWAAPAGASPARVFNIAHRGARSLAPENTLPAFRIAIARCGADMIELDVHLSKDGVPVVIHDDTLERTTDVARVFPQRAPWRVADFTAAELMRLDAGSWFVEQDPFGQIRAGQVSADDLALFCSGRVRLPTLKTALALIKELGCRVNIELKNFPAYYPGLAEKVVAEVRQSGIADRVLFSSFDHEILAELRRLAPEIPRAALVEDPVFPLKEYLVDLLGVVAYNPSRDVLGCDSIAWHREGRLREDVVRRAREAGLEVFVWTVNDPDQLAALVKVGVSGIFTDFPQRLRDLLHSPGAGR